MEERLYTVSSSEDGGWEATESDAGVIASRRSHARRGSAAAKVARQQASASLRLQRRDGTIQRSGRIHADLIRDGRRG